MASYYTRDTLGSRMERILREVGERERGSHPVAYIDLHFEDHRPFLGLIGRGLVAINGTMEPAHLTEAGRAALEQVDPLNPLPTAPGVGG